MVVDMAKFANLTLAFLLELCAVAAFGYWGYQTGSSTLKVGLALAAPLAMTVVWGIFLAPNSSRRLVGLSYISLTLLIFGLSVVALWVVGRHSLAVIMAVAVLVNKILTYVWKQ